jgi:hypothetical protein
MDSTRERSASVTPVPLAAVERFDHGADVLVVGFGCAGAAAAIEGGGGRRRTSGDGCSWTS